jgi:hypothetical protein
MHHMGNRGESAVKNLENRQIWRTYSIIARIGRRAESRAAHSVSARHLCAAQVQRDAE